MLAVLLLGFLLSGEEAPQPSQPKSRVEVVFRAELGHLIRFVHPGQRAGVRVWTRISDPDREYACPKLEYHWGDDTKSTWEEPTCEVATALAVFYPGWKSHTYEAAGRYTIELVIRGAGGRTIRRSVLFEIRDGSEGTEIEK